MYVFYTQICVWELEKKGKKWGPFINYSWSLKALHSKTLLIKVTKDSFAVKMSPNLAL